MKKKSATDYYQLLGLPRDASEQQIKEATRRLMHEYHPDRGGDTDSLQLVLRARQILLDPQQRRDYDAALKELLPQGTVALVPRPLRSAGRFGRTSHAYRWLPKQRPSTSLKRLSWRTLWLWPLIVGSLIMSVIFLFLALVYIALLFALAFIAFSVLPVLFRETPPKPNEQTSVPRPSLKD